MIEELEAEAVAQLVEAERGAERAKVTADHKGTPIEVRARRRSDGGVVLGYSYGGVRLERVVLLTLVCPQAGCERGQVVKREWEARNPPPPVLQRRALSWPVAGASSLGAPLFEEVPVRDCLARPASFAVLTPCPVGAHSPAVVALKGWDVFRNGKCVAGGLEVSPEARTLRPLFPSVDSVTGWLELEDARKP